jgi:ABC-type glycerol-3-phosphate transport system permease component
MTSQALVEYASGFAIGLFFTMLVCLELGRRIGRYRADTDPEGWQAGTGVIEGAIFALLGLMLGFTFSAAIGRVDVRRQQIVAEANAIGTAYLRLDLLPDNEQAPMRDLFRRYTDARLSAYAKVRSDLTAAFEELGRATALQGEIWRATVRATKDRDTSAASRLLLPAVNELIDITAVRTTAARTHNPVLFYVLIAFLLIISSLLAGYAMARSNVRNWLHIIGFALVTTAVVFVIIDIDYPRIGFFRIDTADQVLYETRAAMN